MNVAVDKARCRISAFCIDFYFTLILSDSCDLIAAKGNIPFRRFFPLNTLTYFTILNDRVRLACSAGSQNQFFQFFFFHGSPLLFHQFQNRIVCRQCTVIHRACISQRIIWNSCDRQEEHVHHRIRQVGTQGTSRFIDFASLPQRLPAHHRLRCRQPAEAGIR